MVQYADDDRRTLLGYDEPPTLDRSLVARYALGETALAESILKPFQPERFRAIWSNLVAMARPALSIEVREGTPDGRTKFGGSPDLPRDFEWPRRELKPLSFIAQIDLDEVHDYLRDPALPESGLLSFFYEADRWTSGGSPQDEGAWRVLMLGGHLSRQSPPSASPPAVPDYYDPSRWGFQEAGVKFVPRISLPEQEHLLTPRAGVGLDDYEAYGALMDELRQRHGLSGVTQLLGYPAEIQHDPFITSQLVTTGVDTLTLKDWQSERVRSHSVLSSRLRPSMPRIKVLTAAPHSPDQGQSFAHAMANGVHRGLAGRALPGVMAAEDGIVFDAHDCHAIRCGSQIGIAGFGHRPAGLGPFAFLA